MSCQLETSHLYTCLDLAVCTKNEGQLATLALLHPRDIGKIYLKLSFELAVTLSMSVLDIIGEHNNSTHGHVQSFPACIRWTAISRTLLAASRALRAAASASAVLEM